MTGKEGDAKSYWIDDIEYCVTHGSMDYDRVALQYLYGANMNQNASDHIYAYKPDTPFIETIGDARGHWFWYRCLTALRTEQTCCPPLKTLSSMVFGWVKLITPSHERKYPLNCAKITSS